MRFSAPTAASILLGLPSLILGQELSKPAITPDMRSNAVRDQMHAEITRDLPQHFESSSGWDDNYIPQAWTSLFYTQPSFTYSPWDVETRNIKSWDCAHANAVSRHKGVSISWADIQQIVGRLPVGFRQYISNIIIVPQSAVTVCGYAAGSSILLSEACAQFRTLIHESGHVIDIMALNDVVTGAGYPSGSRYSQTNLWAGAYSADSHVISSYAKTNQVENFAEITAWSITDWTSGEQLSSYTPNKHQIINMISEHRWRTERIVFPGGWPAGGSCTGKVFTTPAVHKNTGARISVEAANGMRIASGQKNELEFLMIPKGAEDVPEIKIPEGIDMTPVACGLELGHEH